MIHLAILSGLGHVYPPLICFLLWTDLLVWPCHSHPPANSLVLSHLLSPSRPIFSPIQATPIALRIMGHSPRLWESMAR